MKKKYAIAIHWSDEDEGYIATCKEFPGVSAFGETYENAAREMEQALDAAIEACRRLGRELPSPNTQSSPVTRTTAGRHHCQMGIHADECTT